jgi:hypothetical protein
MANFNAKRWSEKDVRILENTLDQYEWKIEKLPLMTLAMKFDRTETAVIAKAKRLIEEYNRTYEWSEEEQRGAFHYYLKGLSFKEIHEKLLNFGSEATLEQTEQELLRMKKSYSDGIRTYAEERGLRAAKTMSLETINYFLKHKDTTNDFERKALNNRIARG